MVAISDVSSSASDEMDVAREVASPMKPSFSPEFVRTKQLSQTMQSPCSCSDAPAVEAVSRARSGLKQSAWRLVWCHERCHKQECEPRRQALGDAALEAGGSLVCLKKAARFEMWLKHAQRPPFVLVTDWREVKPCMQAAAQVPASNQPAFTLVLCEEPRHFERASTWAQTLPPRGDPVHVCRDLALVKSFLNGLASRFARAAARPVPAPSPAREVRWSSAAALPWARPEAIQAAGPRCGNTAALPWVLLLSTTPAKARESPSKAAPWAEVAAVMAGPIGQALSCIRPPYDTVRMAEMLKAAMPDHYDD